MSKIQLLDNIEIVYKKIADAAIRAGRSPEAVNLIAVTKTVDGRTVRDAVDAGLRHFAENRVQEARKKITGDIPRLKDTGITWHLIGHLQKNKARIAVDLFDLIQTVDTLALAEELNRQAQKSGKIQRVLIQVSLADEERKHGIPRDDFIGLLEGINGMSSLRVEGLMTMPPFFDDPEMTRPYFRELRKMRDDAETMGFRLPELSMGMSNDFEVAILEGATMVRVGTAIFGERVK